MEEARGDAGLSGRRPLVLAGIALLTLVGPLGLVLGIGDGLPARVGCDCKAEDVGKDWAAHGTATSAPLAPLAVLVAALALTIIGRGWYGMVGVALLVLVSLVMLSATPGEPFIPPEADTPDALIALFRVAAYAALAAVIVLGALDLLARWRGRRQQEAPQP